MKELGNSLFELKKNCEYLDFIKKLEDYFKSFDDNFGESMGDNFELDLGGKVYLVETQEDLKEIQTPLFDKVNNKYYTLFEKAAQFDVCDFVNNSLHQPVAVHLLLCTHNGGGNTYLIPIDIANANPNVMTSLRLTNENY